MITSIWRLFKKSFSAYANVSGRSGRAEFWVFVLGSWVLIYAVSALTWGAFWAADTLFHDAEYSDTRSDHHERKGDWRDGDRHEDDWHDGNWNLNFTIHRHGGDDSYHMHGVMTGDHEAALDDGHQKDTAHDGTMTNDEDMAKDEDRHFGAWERHHRVDDAAETAGFLVWIALIIPFFAVGARRLHDTGKSGWWQLFYAIPVAGWLVMLIFMLLPSDTDDNAYGPAPTPPDAS